MWIRSGLQLEEGMFHRILGWDSRCSCWLKKCCWMSSEERPFVLMLLIESRYVGSVADYTMRY
jgi:hypothetical protein